MSTNFYQLSAESIHGKVIPMSQYKGKIILIVNTSNNCGLVKQYKGLEYLYQKYKDRGLVVLGFFCNQFIDKVQHTVVMKPEFVPIPAVGFPLFKEVHCVGEFIHPIFDFLKKSIEGPLGNDIKWNFTKFLLDRNGKPIKRFPPITKPENLEKDIEELILAQHNLNLN